MYNDIIGISLLFPTIPIATSRINIHEGYPPDKYNTILRISPYYFRVHLKKREDQHSICFISKATLHLCGLKYYKAKHCYEVTTVQSYTDGLCEVFIFGTSPFEPTEGPFRLSEFSKTL